MNQNENNKALSGNAKPKKIKTPWAMKKKRVVFCSCSTCIGVMIGRLGFRLFGHSAPKNNYDAFFPGYDYLALEDSSSRNDLSKKSKTNKGQAVLAVNKGLINRYSKKYTLLYRTQVVNVKIANTKQNIEAFTYFSPDRNFNQNISSSSFVHTADRYYDNKDGKIDFYSAGTPDKWKDTEKKEYTYDERRDRRGKLVAPLYFLNQDKKGNRKFSTYNKDDTGWNTQESGVFNFDLSEDSVADAKWEKQGRNYLVTITMDSEHTIGYKKRARQRKRTGGLKNLPNFKKVTLELTLDASLNLKKAITTCDYVAERAGIKAECSSKDQTYFYTSDTPFTNDQGEELAAPSPHEETGDKNQKDEPKLLAYARGLSK